MMTPHRLTFDDLLAEQREFIGPPAPPQIPKFTPKAEREAVQAMPDDRAARFAAGVSAHKR
ncbi:hypothetical protein M3N55_12045 [Roseibaca sp. V10]|uniref:Uncharacterized protein n=1 Tax=Roseinatronobacter domitianus TaxID=2940293 RepID=A0ABT0M3M8_9RHOB|nr:hypothetical protein [Roseibaca domitiana]MCL1629462.1 hypothetical protein [Roseibaca domitiana]